MSDGTIFILLTVVLFIFIFITNYFANKRIKKEDIRRQQLGQKTLTQEINELRDREMMIEKRENSQPILRIGITTYTKRT